MKFFSSRPKPPLQVRVRKATILLLKCLLMLVMPLVPVVTLLFIWYRFIFLNEVCFSEKMENIVVAAWIPIFGIIYSLLVAVVFSCVWAEYKTIRSAVKKHDFDTFADLRDEDISPLVHTLVLVFSLAIIGGFMSLKYHDAVSGAIVIGVTIYLLSLIFFVVCEIDDPCSGLWYIQHIPKEWLMVDVRVWRAENTEEKRRKNLDAIRELIKKGAHVRAFALEIDPPSTTEKAPA